MPGEKRSLRRYFNTQLPKKHELHITAESDFDFMVIPWTPIFFGHQIIWNLFKLTKERFPLHLRYIL